MKQFEQTGNEERRIYWPYGLETKMNRVTAEIALRRYSVTLKADAEVDLCVNGEDGTEVHFLRMALIRGKK